MLEEGISKYRWIFLKVKSPALWATDDGFPEIHGVVGTLQ